MAGLGGVKMEMTELDAAQSSRACVAISSNSSAMRPARRYRSCRGVRGRLRRSARAGAATRPRPRRRGHALREDRPTDLNPGSARGRQGPTSRANGIRGRIQKQLRALDTPLLLRRPSSYRAPRQAYRCLRPSGGRVACCERGEGRRFAGVRQERLPRRGRLPGPGQGARPRARPGEPIREGDVLRDPKGTEGCPARRDFCGCAGSGAHEQRSRPERAAGRRDRGARPGVRLAAPAPARRQRSSSGSPRRSANAGRRRLDARDHLHGARRRRLRGRIRAACASRTPGSARGRSRSLELHHPRLLPAAAEGASVRCPRRPALPRCRREPGPSHPKRGVRGGSERFCAGDDPERLGRARPTEPPACAGR